MGVDDVVVRRAQRRVGQRLRDKWTLERLLGVGGMAAVYAGTHRNGTHGAIKILHPELSMDSEFRARFLREGYAANTIAHPGVARVIDDDEDEGTVFLVMELLEGESIDNRATREGGRLPLSEVLALADHVLDVLVAARAAKVVHRDIKPENLFLTSNGEVKLLDFGIARMGGPGSGHGTNPGATMGTPAYMAPEQARGNWKDVDDRTDLWALGATMFTLISGQFVHGSRDLTQNELLVAAVLGKAPTLASVAPDTPEKVVAIIDRALAFDKESRWPDARAMQHEVRLAYHDLFGTPITTAPRLMVPVEAASIASGSSKPLTTDRRSPLGFSRTTLDRYIREPRGRALAGALLVLTIGIGGVLVTRKPSVVVSTPASAEPPTPAPTAKMKAESPPAAAPTAETLGPAPALSPTELPPAQPEEKPRSSNGTPEAAKIRSGPAIKKPPVTPAPSPAARVDGDSPSNGTPRPPAPAPAKPAKPHDVLDQQW